jgi:DNA-binding NtrC family response regulator
VPALALLSLTDSFAMMWSALAAECGLTLSIVGEPAELTRLGDAVGVISAGGGEELLAPAVLQGAGSATRIAAVGATADHRLAGAVVGAGAAQYFALPGDYDLLRSWLRERADRLRSAAQRDAFSDGERHKYRFDGILGESAALRAAIARAARVIPHPSVTILLTGETGTGKELFARAIHYNGPRRQAPFVDVNCTAIPDQLLESELFGHEKGAFTDASAAKPGLFELANGGTLFLDEIGHLAYPLQGKLLRVLQERSIRRVGGTRAIPVDVRVVAATHVRLAEAVRRGEFREDLYYRLNVVQIELPPLRARREDVLPLARHFLAGFAAEYGVPTPPLTPAAERALLERTWKGNVRELRNALERAVLLATGPVIDVEDVRGDGGADEAAPGGEGAIPFPAPLHDVVRDAAERMLALTGGNRSEAARRLGISRSRLQRLLEGHTTEENGDAVDA